MKVHIYKPSKSTMQSGHGKTNKWVLEYELASKRTPEPLMGWVSSEDTNNQIQLKFDTQEEAIAYAESKGWQYEVAVTRDRRIKPRNYMDNFKYIPAQDDA